MKKTQHKILRLIVFLSFIQFFTELKAQVVPNIDWVQHYSYRDSIENMSSALDANNNVYVTGYVINANTFDRDIITLKYDSLGTLLWAEHYDGGSGDDEGKSIKVDNAGNVFVCGYITDPSNGKEAFIIKYSAAGNMLWRDQFDSGNQLDDELVDMKINNSTGSIFMVGTSMNSSWINDILVLHYDFGGTYGWHYLYDGQANNDDIGVSISLTSNNDMYVSGNSQNNNLDYDICVFLIDANGGFHWDSYIAGSNGMDDLAYASVITGGDAVICGRIANSSNPDYTTFRIDPSGTVLWQQNYDFNNTTDFATALVRDSIGNIAVTGLVYNNPTEYHTILYDSTGNQLWVNKQNTGIMGFIIQPRIACDTIAHHFYVSGAKETNSNTDLMVYQITPGGNTSWIETYDGPGNNTDMATALSVNGVGVVYLSGNCINSNWMFEISTLRISQTPVYFPIDFNNQTASNSHLYLKNEGQLVRTDSTLANEVLYYCPTSNPEVYLEKNAFNFVFSKVDTSVTALDTLERIQCRFLNSNPLTSNYNYNPRGHFYNFFLGYAASPAIPNLRANERVFIPNFYHLIDLHYYSSAEGIKYYFVCKPGAKPDAIILNVEGALNTYTNGSNNLFIDGKLGDVELYQPIAYQVNTLQQVDTLNAAYWDNVSTDHYGLILPAYTPSLPLVIMVSKKTTLSSAAAASGNLDYSTYYGNINNDIFNDVKVANNGDRYVVGNTDGVSFPKVNSTSTYKGSRDAVFLKYSNIKDSLVFASFYGGAGDDFGNSIDINSTDEIFIGGQTFSSGSNGIPITFVPSASNQTVNGGFNVSGGTLGDGFLVRFVPTGNVISWSRYFGGSQDDGINSIYIDNSDNLHFTGFARSNNITMTNAAQPSISTGTATNVDAIVGKLSNSIVMIYSTYFGGGNSPFGSTQDIGRDITVDGSGNAIVVGHTDASNLPVNNSTGNTNTFYKTSLGGARDGFIVRYSPSGTKQFASYFGGNGAFGIDEITRVNYNVAKDEIYFAGQSNDTTNFPYANLTGAFNLKRKATNAAFIASMLGDLTKQWCTNYGRTSATNFSVTGVTSDNAGIIYLTGQAKSSTLNYPVNSPTLTVYEDTLRNADDGFVVIFNPQKDLFHAYYLGGTGNDYINNANVGANKKLYVVGQSGSTDYPVAYDNINVAFIDSTFGGGQYDGFITRFDMTTIQIINVKEIAEKESYLNVFPNPTVNGFMLQLKDSEIKNANVKIYNLTGQLILEKSVTEQQTSFSCENWANGVYLIRVNLNENLQTFKLIKN